MFVKNNPRAIGKAFLIDQLNSYKEIKWGKSWAINIVGWVILRLIS